MTARVPVSRGDTFGRLTALQFLGMRAQQQEWSLTCSCGVRVRRTIADLRAALARGREPMCSRCRHVVGGQAGAKAKRVKKTERRTLRLLEAIGFEVLL